MGIFSWSKTLEVKYQADVAVLGGGIAGVTAACAAAKSGAKVVLVENFAATGGNMTTGGVAGFCGETAGQGEVFDEIVEGLTAFGGISPYAPYGTRYDPDRIPGSKDGRLMDTELLSIVLQEVLLKRDIKLLLHTKFIDVIMEGNRIEAVVLCGASGTELLTASQYIDTTGEAQVAHSAGFTTRKGRPEDGLQLPMSFKLYIDRMPKEDGTPIPEGWF
ncbi:MAG: FAD-dependent oxidoreductase, partial [Spirochaetales bacterium]|nr:FAD-dependent oxidoreductase [Spirochaetales bacterium]